MEAAVSLWEGLNKEALVVFGAALIVPYLSFVTAMLLHFRPHTWMQRLRVILGTTAGFMVLVALPLWGLYFYDTQQWWGIPILAFIFLSMVTLVSWDEPPTPPRRAR